MGVPGVSNVVIWGQKRRQLHVQVDPKVLDEKRKTDEKWNELLQRCICKPYDSDSSVNPMTGKNLRASSNINKKIKNLCSKKSPLVDDVISTTVKPKRETELDIDDIFDDDLSSTKLSMKSKRSQKVGEYLSSTKMSMKGKLSQKVDDVDLEDVVQHIYQR